MRRFILPRRTLLRGLGGVAVGLPVLECMLNSTGEALAQAGALPKRYAIVFAGQSIGGDGWEEDRYMVAGERKQETGHFIADTAAGAGYTCTTPLKPLQALDLMGDFSMVSNLKIPWNTTSVEPADVPAGGAFRDFHGGGSGPLLCGTRSTSASFKAASITSDQIPISRSARSRSTRSSCAPSPTGTSPARASPAASTSPTQKAARLSRRRSAPASSIIRCSTRSRR